MAAQPDSVTVRSGAAGDYDSIIFVWAEAGLPYRPKGRDSRDNVQRELERGRSALFVAESAGRVVGVALGTHDGRKGWINRLAVIPAFQRRGIARRLVQEVEAWLEIEGIELCAALVETANQSSLAFFADIGYLHDLDIEYVSKRKSPDT